MWKGPLQTWLMHRRMNPLKAIESLRFSWYSYETYSYTQVCYSHLKMQNLTLATLNQIVFSQCSSSSKQISDVVKNIYNKTRICRQIKAWAVFHSAFRFFMEKMKFPEILQNSIKNTKHKQRNLVISMRNFFKILMEFHFRTELNLDFRSNTNWHTHTRIQ